MMAILHARTFASGKLQHASLQYSNQSRSSTVDKHGCPETIEAPSPTQSACYSNNSLESLLLSKHFRVCSPGTSAAREPPPLDTESYEYGPAGLGFFRSAGCHSKQKILCPFPMGLWAPQNLLIESIQALLSTFIFLIPNNLHHHRMLDIQGWDPLPEH